MSDPDEIEAGNLKLVRLHYAAYASGDIDGIVETLDPGIEITAHDEHGAREGDRIRGHESARRFFDEILSAVTNQSVAIEELRADNNRVLATVTLGGTSRASGRTGAIAAVHLFTCHDGLVTTIRTHRPDWRKQAGE